MCNIFLEYSYQQFVVLDHADFMAKGIVMNFSRPCSMPNASLSMLLKQDPALVRLLLWNVIGCNSALLGALFLWNHLLSLT